MTVPRGAFELHRPNTADASPLRAWSAADQLVLDHLDTDDLGRVLIVNDEFGALAVGLHDAERVVWSDSALSRDAIRLNLVENNIARVAAFVRGHEVPTGRFDTVVVRVPKTSALLEYQLQMIAPCCDADTRVVGAAMARHVHSSTTQCFEASFGPTTTSRATRKARLIHAEHTGRGPLPETESRSFVTDSGVMIAEMPGTFSAGRVDIGSALLLRVLAASDAPAVGAVVADLGCGNGVLAATLATHWPDANFVLLDVSDLAIAAARQTFARNGLSEQGTFLAADGFGEIAAESIDMVVTNPPFHQGHALDADMTDRLLADASRALKRDGVLYLVAQRHLQLHTRLKRWFNSVEVASKHPSHVVLVGSHPR